jgi:hypothetical protein
MLVEAEKAVFKITTMCRALRVSRAEYYAWKVRPESQRSKDVEP